MKYFTRHSRLRFLTLLLAHNILYPKPSPPTWGETYGGNRRHRRGTGRLGTPTTRTPLARMEAAVESPRAEGKRKRRRTTAASTDAKIPASSPRVGSPRAAEKAEADAAKAAVADDIDCSCPVCMDPVACAAKAQCGHALCWTCAHQICRVADDDHPAHCPMCRAVIREHEDEAGRNGTLGRCAAMDAAADRLAAETMDTTALAMWKEKREEGEAIVSRIEEDRDVGRAYRVTAGDGYASLEIHLAASIAPSGRAVCKVRGKYMTHVQSKRKQKSALGCNRL